MAIVGLDYTGLGTQENPYHIKTVEGFLYCVNQLDAICFVDNDLYAKDDVRYRERMSTIVIRASVICGKAYPYDSSITYNPGDIFTYHDQVHGYLSYRCIRTNTGESPLNTNYYVPIDSETESGIVRLCGFKVFDSSFIYATDVRSCTISNLYFDSCVHTKTVNGYDGSTFLAHFDSDTFDVTKLTFNDCVFSMFIENNGFGCTIDPIPTIYKNRCSEYYEFANNRNTGDDPAASAGSGPVYNTYPLLGATRNYCTVCVKNMCVHGQRKVGEFSLLDLGVFITNATGCSFTGDLGVGIAGNNDWKYVMVQMTHCFFTVRVYGYNAHQYNSTWQPDYKIQFVSNEYSNCIFQYGYRSGSSFSTLLFNNNLDISESMGWYDSDTDSLYLFWKITGKVDGAFVEPHYLFDYDFLASKDIDTMTNPEWGLTISGITDDLTDDSATWYLDLNKNNGFPYCSKAGHYRKFNYNLLSNLSSSPYILDSLPYATLAHDASVMDFRLPMWDMIMRQNYFYDFPFTTLSNIPDDFDFLKPLIELHIINNVFNTFPFSCLNSVPNLMYYQKTFQPLTQLPNVFKGFALGMNTEPFQLGAFRSTHHIKDVKLPVTVIKLGEYTFKDSSVQTVTISPDTDYYDTTFPETTQILYWPIILMDIVPPEKTLYFVDEQFDETGMVITIRIKDSFNNYAERQVTDKYQILGFHPGVAGIYTLQLYYARSYYQIPGEYRVVAYNKRMVSFSQKTSLLSEITSELTYTTRDKCVSVLMVLSRSPEIVVSNDWSFMCDSEVIDDAGETQKVSVFTKRNYDVITDTVTYEQLPRKTKDMISNTWEQGSGDSSGNMNVDNNYQIRCPDFIEIKSGSEIMKFEPTNTDNTKLQVWIYFYSTDDVSGYLSRQGWKNYGDIIEIPENAKYFRIILRISSSTTFTPDMLGSCVYYEYAKMSGKVLSLYNPYTEDGFSTLSVVENTLLDTVPYTPVAKNHKRRMYILSSAYSYSNNDIVAQNTNTDYIYLIYSPKFKVYYDYNADYDAIPSFSYTRPQDYVSNSINLLTIDIS